jgi:CheY-like chemotaxis protein
VSRGNRGEIGARRTPAEVGAAVEHGPAGVRLVVVDDSPAVRQTIALLAGYAGALVVGEYERVGQALRHAGSVDVVLTDYQLPDGTGVALAQTWRERAPSIPVAFMSGGSPDAVLDAISRAGIWAWLPKAVKLSQLAALLELVRLKAPVPGPLVGAELVKYMCMGSGEGPDRNFVSR